MDSACPFPSALRAPSIWPRSHRKSLSPMASWWSIPQASSRPARPAGGVDVGRGPGRSRTAGGDRRTNDRAARQHTGLFDRAAARSRGVGEIRGARVEPRSARNRDAPARAFRWRPVGARAQKPAQPRVCIPTLRHLADRVASRLRAKSRVARTVTVRVRFADLRSVTRSVTLDAPISATVILAEIAEELVRAALREHPRGTHDLVARDLRIATRAGQRHAA